MAIQVHVAHSAIFQKMASIAGPPYRCAEGEIGTALSACTIEPMLINLNLMISTTGKYYSQGEIDDPTNLANSSVWLFSGTKDTIVHTGVVKKSLEYYQHYITNSKLIQFINTIPAEHSWVTDNYGNPCGIFKKPFLNNCNYDAAGILLQFFFGSLNPPVAVANLSNIIQFDQGLYTPDQTSPKKLSLAQTGYAYIPTNCWKKQLCKLHVSFHGCEMCEAEIGNDFYVNSGLNEWGESNNIIIVYPQTIPSELLPYNPDACWDWWGYTNNKYATKEGPQIVTTMNIISAFAGTNATALH